MQPPIASAQIVEYVVIGGTVAVSAATIRFFGNAVLEIRDWVREHGRALVKTTEKHTEDIKLLTGRVEVVEQTMSSIGRICVAMHGDVVVRGEE